MTPRPNVMRRNLQAADQLANTNGGKLPPSWRMIQMGHEGLHRYIKRHRNAFGHLEFEPAVKIDNKTKSPFNISIREQHIETAKLFNKKYKGIPDSSWLNKHGFSRLAAYMRTYPDVFAKMKRVKSENMKTFLV